MTTRLRIEDLRGPNGHAFAVPKWLLTRCCRLKPVQSSEPSHRVAAANSDLWGELWVKKETQQT